MSVLRRCLEDLPRAQQVVVALRDIHGWPSADVCAALGISEANQRVVGAGSAACSRGTSPSNARTAPLAVTVCNAGQFRIRIRSTVNNDTYDELTCKDLVEIVLR